VIAPALGSRSREGSIPLLIGASAVTLLVWTIGEAAGLFLTKSPIFFEPRYVIGYVTIVPCCLGILYAGKWVRGSDIARTHYTRIAVFGFAGAGGFLAFNLALMAFFPTESFWLVTNWIRWALSIGLAVGLLIGIAQARSISSTVTAERQSIHAEHVEKQRDLMDHMNAILRHEVLNATQTIVGNTSMLLEADEPIDPTDERLARIHRRGEELSTVIQEVRTVMHAMQDDRKLERIDLSEVVRNEVQKIEDSYLGATIRTRLPERVPVQGDPLIGRVFGNLLSNAVEHNDPEAVQVDVDVETGPDEVVVTVRDDGSGIPPDELDTLFDRPYRGDHGLGLYLVRNLVESYGGTLELASTGEEGTTFEVTFPIAEPARPDAQGSET